MSLIGTAGHVDHGKSTLVKALTGIDPDRLAEEKARGMTIDLGFAWLTLPSGREASVVDVPGHESFIKNMLSGVGGIDVALLVIAADEGIMPQTEEHLAILDLLRVRCGVVALTKADLVEPEWLELVREEVAERLAPTTLAGSAIIACSAITRAGLPELLAALDAALDASPARRDIGRPRLPVDRVFTISGFGAVVTGALQDGELRLGQEVALLPSTRVARIRGLQAHKHAVEAGAPGGRLAINLAGVTHTDLARGMVVTLPGMLRPTSAFDAQLEIVASAPRPIPHNALLDVYAGAAESPARVLLLDADELRPGETGWAQFRLTRPLVLARGDRFIVRVPSPSLTVGGGMVVEPLARRHRRHDAAILTRLAALAQGDPEELALIALRPQNLTTQSASGSPSAKARRPSGSMRPYGASEPDAIAHAIGLPPDDCAAALSALSARAMIVSIGSLIYAVNEWQRLCADSAHALADYHARYPLRPGIPREEWRSRLGLAPRDATEALAALTASGLAREVIAGAGARGVFLRLPDFTPHFTPEQQRAVTALLQRFDEQPFTPPTRADVEDTLGAEITTALIERGSLLRINDSILLTPDATAEATRRIVAHLHAHGRITVAEARDLLGATRKYMLAIFERLDEQRITRRDGDDRILGPNAPASATGE